MITFTPIHGGFELAGLSIVYFLHTHYKQLLKYEKKFEQAKSEVELVDGEEMTHCIDSSSHDGICYFPEWAITNMGRGYSLWKMDWLIPQALGTNRDYWGFCGSDNRNPKVHQLVANYFKDESDLIALEFFEEDGTEIHHEIPIEIPEHLRYGCKENAQERIEHCMKCNAKSNLSYQEKYDDHPDDGRITRGNETKGEEGNVQWSSELKMMRILGANSTKSEGNSFGSRIRYKKDEKGNLVRTRNMKWTMKGTNQ